MESKMAGVGHTAPKYMPNRHLVFGGEGVTHEPYQRMGGVNDVRSRRRGRAVIPAEFPAAMAHDGLYALADLGGSVGTRFTWEYVPINPHIGLFGDEDHGAASRACTMPGVSGNSAAAGRFHAPTLMTTSAVIVQTTSVSMNGSSPATTPSRTGSSVFAALWAMGAEPCPASFEKSARFMPQRNA